MRVGLVALIATAFLGLAACDGDDPTENLPGVVDITPENVDQYINGGKNVLVEFYAPWCGHCKKMVNDYKALGEAVLADAALAQRVVIAKVNADTHKELGKRFGVSGFPTIKWFPRGKPVDKPQDYQSGRSTAQFLEFINDKIKADKSYSRIEELDTIVAKFVAPGANKKAVLGEVEAAVKKLEGAAKANGELYVKMAKKGIEKGDTYYTTETERLERMVAKGSTAKAKVDEMLSKISVLSSFIDGANAKEE